MGIIQCGSFSGNTTTTIGWEPQWIMIKRTDAAGNWITIDNMRGCAVGGVDAVLFPNLASAESVSNDYIDFTATGFISKNLTGTYIYTVIRRPMKVPTSGTEVYNAIARTGTGAVATVTGVGFAPDFLLSKAINQNINGGITDRLRGLGFIIPSSVGTEQTGTDTVRSFDSNGVTFGADGSSAICNIHPSFSYINHFFKRAKGFFDVVCYTGTGVARTVNHNLGVVPELWLVKGRSGSTQWVWGSSLLANIEKIVMPSPNGKVTDTTVWNSTYPTSTLLPLGTSSTVNTSSAAYVAYMWATVAGVSKVGSYTGNGTTQTINCGFSTGARLIMIIRTTASTAQDIFIWDTARGIVAANDPHLSLNTTAAEVTTDDSVDPESSGFIVNQNATTNINVNGGSYIFLAIS